jgi:hypothetical protein
VIQARYEEAVAALATASWFKSTHSQGENACVEVASALIGVDNWHKASYSQGANGCVEVGSVPSVIGVRDSKLGPASPILAFGPASWATFTDRLKDAATR